MGVGGSILLRYFLNFTNNLWLGIKKFNSGGGGVQPQHPVPMNAYKPALCTGNKEQVHVKPVSTTFTKGTYCGKN